MELDHVLIAAHAETWHGLASIAGGRYPGWGTANRIVPLGETYLELVAVVEEAEAARLGLTVHEGSRLTPDGRRRWWRMAGIERAAAESSLPFVIEWGPETPFPGAAGPFAEVSLELQGDADRVGAWLGSHELPITAHPGEPGVVSVTVGGRRLR